MQHTTIAIAIASAALASFALAELLVATAPHHGRYSMDRPGGVQKFHSNPTPRIGGIGIYLAALLASRFMPDADTSEMMSTLLIAGIPALIVGLLEDVTKRVGIRTRLAATIASGALACGISGVTLTQVGVPGLDSLLAVAPVAGFFTAFAVSGVANAFNIIDGFNGLASGTATMCLAALATIAAMAGDAGLVVTSAVIAASVVGFWFVNFPWGKLFLGDGGAYFAGFAVAWLAVLLPIRNPGVSPWASLLVCAYPITEVAYSVIRRRMCKQSPGHADRRHLHSLVAMHVVQRRAPGLDPVLQNSAVSVIMWLCAALPAAAAIAFHDKTGMLILCAVACIASYHFLCRQVART